MKDDAVKVFRDRFLIVERKILSLRESATDIMRSLPVKERNGSRGVRIAIAVGHLDNGMALISRSAKYIDLPAKAGKTR